MNNEIFLQGLSISDLKETLRVVVADEIKNLLTELTQTKDETPDLMTRKEVCQYLGISYPTLDKYTKEGAIEGKIVGNSIRYTKDAVMSALRDIETIKYKRA